MEVPVFDKEFHVFLTFYMDQLAKVIRHRWKVSELKSDLLTTNEHKALQSGENLRMLEQWGTIAKRRWIFLNWSQSKLKKNSENGFTVGRAFISPSILLWRCQPDSIPVNQFMLKKNHNKDVAINAR